MLDTTNEALTNTGKAIAFAFGDPEPVLSNHLTDYLGVFMDVSGDYYRPPVDLSGLADLMNANAYHGPILHFKANLVAKWFMRTPFLDTVTLRRLALDYAVFGNAYPQLFFNRLGKIVRIGWLPAISMRPTQDPAVFVKLRSVADLDYAQRNTIKFNPGEVLHLKEYDVKQGVFGIPQYLGGIQSVLLSEDSTLFRRKFFMNGAHMGYILVTTDAGLDEETAKAIEAKVRESKGPGNFRSLYLNIPRSNNKEPVQVIPVGQFGSKDEYQAIKDVTQEEMLIMHRCYPGLVPALPANVGGFGDLEKSMRVYYEMEVTAMQQVFLQLNELLGLTAVQFREPDWKTNGGTI